MNELKPRHKGTSRRAFRNSALDMPRPSVCCTGKLPWIMAGCEFRELLTPRFAGCVIPNKPRLLGEGMGEGWTGAPAEPPVRSALGIAWEPLLPASHTLPGPGEALPVLKGTAPALLQIPLLLWPGICYMEMLGEGNPSASG